MKKPIPTGTGLAISETLYGNVDGVDTDSNIAKPTDSINIFGRPPLIRGIEYPVSDDVEQMLEKAYLHGYSDAMRMNRAGHLVEDDPLLDAMRKRVDEIRKERGLA